MTPALLEAANALGGEAFVAALLVFLRVGAAMALLPAFGERSVPARVRLVLALAFTAIVAPAVAEGMPTVLTAPVLAAHLASETLAGLALGIMLRLFVLILQVAGAIAAQATSLSQILGVPGAEPMAAIGHIMMTGGLALAAILGLHLRVAEALILSYEALPAGRLPDAGILADWGVSGVARTFGLAFSLAAPFAAGALVWNAAMGVVNRAMPQLMVAFVGAPAVTALGLGLLALTMPFMLEVWADALNGFLADPFGPLP